MCICWLCGRHSARLIGCGRSRLSIRGRGMSRLSIRVRGRSRLSIRGRGRSCLGIRGLCCRLGGLRRGRLGGFVDSDHFGFFN